VAINSASIALMNNDLRRLPFLIRLSRKTTRIIWQNLLGGVAYIVVLEVIGALGWITPMWAAFFHAVASALVIFNSARLVRFGEQLGTVETSPKTQPRGEVGGPSPVLAPVPA